MILSVTVAIDMRLAAMSPRLAIYAIKWHQGKILALSDRPWHHSEADSKFALIGGEGRSCMGVYSANDPENGIPSPVLLGAMHLRVRR
jgi:hypothetical protein